MKPKSGLFAFLGSARAAVGSFRKIGQFFDHLNFEKYEPGSLYVGPFLAKNFLKIDEIKIRPLTPPQNHFNTLPVLVADACIQEGWENSQRRPRNGSKLGGGWAWRGYILLRHVIFPSFQKKKRGGGDGNI